MGDIIRPDESFTPSRRGGKDVGHAPKEACEEPTAVSESLG